MFDYTLILAVDLSLHPLHKADITIHALPHSGIPSLYTLHWSKRFEKKCAWNKNMMTSTALVRNIRWKTKRKSQKSRHKHLKNPISLFKVFLYRTAIISRTRKPHFVEDRVVTARTLENGVFLYKNLMDTIYVLGLLSLVYCV